MKVTQSRPRCKVANTIADNTVMNGAITAAANMLVDTGISITLEYTSEWKVKRMYNDSHSTKKCQ